MADLESHCLEAFPQWLRALSDDALALSQVLENESIDEPARRHAGAALNYLFKSLDLIPDGIEDLGFIDDAFVFRVAAALAASPGESGDEGLARLADEASLVREFLGDDYERLERFVRGLDKTVARGRSVDDIMSDSSVRQSLVNDVKAWAGNYTAPTFARDSKNLVKLKSFLSTKLPE